MNKKKKLKTEVPNVHAIVEAWKNEEYFQEMVKNIVTKAVTAVIVENSEAINKSIFKNIELVVGKKFEDGVWIRNTLQNSIDLSVEEQIRDRFKGERYKDQIEKSVERVTASDFMQELVKL